MDSDRRDPAGHSASHPSSHPARDPAREGTCLGSTCMKWGGDGELAPQDLQAILARLSEVDAQAQALMECPVDPG
ncbi:hypothetical protein [Cyanobium sp. NIES-981]|uniref:hypothetical protein n=1 Tax=Cyanobium sp. NIES-981 TaxID=1851505 RepID=UPI0007DCBC3F|nr:hypothetical protein [Cyanobium sp. NIES-981]SBO42604.1 protein of unknown function [Cyanobium sp. NIES-981]